MNRQDAERTITEYLKPIFGFALKRCKNIQDAQDLSQEIAARVFRALLIRDDIADMGKFIWTVAHNALSNYYRDSAKSVVGVPMEEAAELIADPCAAWDAGEDAEALRRLQTEIAYLSKLQRRIVIACYFEGRRQEDISKQLGIPLGTVKWHLFQAKKELKRGMDTMRKASELKFNPVKFHSWGINGTVGTKSPEEFMRSALAQNICYCVRNTARTVNEIADDLGVSPVYVEAEAEFLEEYGFLLAQKEKYLLNFIISEPTAALLALQNDMYRRAAGLFANALYDELTASGILDDPDIRCPKADRNFLLWTLIPYIAACGGEKVMDKRISFEEVATIRPDGAHNIYYAAVVPEDLALPDDYVSMKNWCGPMWNGDGKQILWQIDSAWSDRGEHGGFQSKQDARRVLALYAREALAPLSLDEYAWLAERGYIKTTTDRDGKVRAAWQIVVLAGDAVRDRLLAAGERIKLQYRADLEALKAPYARAVLQSVPAHLKKVKEYELQYVFYSDGWFLLHCVTALLQNGKLKEPTEEQRKALTTLIVNA